MRVLIINSVCKYGSTGQIVYDLYKSAIRSGHEVKLCYGRGDRYPTEKNLIKIESVFQVFIHALLTRLTGYQGKYSWLASRRLKSLINEFNPSVIFLGNLHGYYLSEFKLLKQIKDKKIPCFYFMFDEYPYLGRCAYSRKCEQYQTECKKCEDITDYPKSWFFDRSNSIFKAKQKAYADFKLLSFISVPFNIAKARKSALLKDKRLIDIGWGIDLVKKYYPRDSSELRKGLKIPPQNKVVIAIAPLDDPRKGIKKYFYEAAKLLANDNITFIHIGFSGVRSICPSNVIPVAFQKDQNILSEYVSMADLVTITSLSDTFPTVCLIALGCGTPVCGFNISGFPFMAPQELSTLVRPGDIRELAQTIKNAPRKTQQMANACRKFALEHYDKETINQTILNLAEIELKSHNRAGG